MTSILLGVSASVLPASEESAPRHVQPFPSSHLEGARCINFYVECTSHGTKRPLPVACHLLAHSGKMGFKDLSAISISLSPGGIPVVLCAHPAQRRF